MPAKPVAKITCKANKCRVQLAGAPRGRATLTRNGRVHASGKLPRKLTAKRTIKRGSYTLRIGAQTFRATVI